jgi:hypothetical protein
MHPIHGGTVHSLHTLATPPPLPRCPRVVSLFISRASPASRACRSHRRPPPPTACALLRCPPCAAKPGHHRSAPLQQDGVPLVRVHGGRAPTPVAAGHDGDLGPLWGHRPLRGSAACGGEARQHTDTHTRAHSLTPHTRTTLSHIHTHAHTHHTPTRSVLPPPPAMTTTSSLCFPSPLPRPRSPAIPSFLSLLARF